jgi:transposase
VVFYEDTPKSGRVWQAYGLPSERGPKKRDGRLLAPHGARGGQEGGPGASETLRPGRICADKGYAKGVVRRYLRRLGINITIARRSNEHRGGPFDRAIYRTRNLVERLINRLKHFRRVATRYEKRAQNYEAMLKLAAIKIWL